MSYSKYRTTDSSTVSSLFNFGIRGENLTIQKLQIQGASCRFCSNRNRNKYCSVKRKHVEDNRVCEFYGKEVLK